MVDDHNALLAEVDIRCGRGGDWTGKYKSEISDVELCRRLAAELRALTSRHHTALDNIRDALSADNAFAAHTSACAFQDTYCNACRLLAERQSESFDRLRAVLDQAKDRAQ